MLEGGHVNAYVALLLQAIEVIPLVVLEIILVEGVGLRGDGGLGGGLGAGLLQDGVLLQLLLLLQVQVVEQGVRVVGIGGGLLEQAGGHQGDADDDEQHRGAHRRHDPQHGNGPAAPGGAGVVVLVQVDVVVGFALQLFLFIIVGIGMLHGIPSFFAHFSATKYTIEWSPAQEEKIIRKS